MTTKAASSKNETVVMGIKVTIDNKAIETMAKDFLFLDEFTSNDSMDQFRAFTRLLKAALGDQYRSVLKELQGDDEVLAVEKVAEFANGVFKANDSLKN